MDTLIKVRILLAYEFVLCGLCIKLLAIIQMISSSLIITQQIDIIEYDCHISQV